MTPTPAHSGAIDAIHSATRRRRRAAANSLSITNFLTDGSLPLLAEQLSKLTTATITLRDRAANTILHRDATPPWAIQPPPDDHDAERFSRALEHAPQRAATHIDEHHTLVPIHVDTQPIGALLVHHPEPETHPGLLDTALAVAATVSERCTEVEELRRRNDELSVLFALTSELVAVRDLESTLAVALNAALAALEIDAGLIHLLQDGEDNPPHTVAEGIPPRLLPRLEDIARTDNTPAPSTHPAPHDPTAPAADTRTPDLADLMAQERISHALRAPLLRNNRIVGEIRVFSQHKQPFPARAHALLRNIAEQVTAAVASHRLEQRARRDRQIRRQVQLAGQVQQRLLPHDNQRSGRLDVAARYLPSTELGGDFYDLIDLDQHLGLVVADVVGKGVPAALLMASVRATLRAQAQRLKRKDDLEEVARRVNNTLNDDTQPHEFATAFLARINTETLEVLYTSAGHDPPFIIRCNPDGTPASETPEPLTAGGPLLGVSPDSTYDTATTTLNPRDILVAYTDGVTDAMNFQFQKFTRDRLHHAVTQLLQSDPNASARQVVDRIVWDVRRFAGLNAELDDITVVAARALPN